MLKQAKAGYPNSKKGRKMKYEDNLIQKQKANKKLLSVPYKLIITILSIIKSH